MRTVVALGLSLPLLACSPARVDYGALTRAAEERQRAVGLAAETDNVGVAALLSRPLSADSAARVAVLNNQAARAAVEELGIAEAELVGARRLPNPTLEAALRFEGEERPAIELGAMLDLSDLLLYAARSGAASSEVEAAKLSAVGAVLDVSFEARRAFLRHQADVALLSLRREVLSTFDAAAELAQRLRAAGNITELDAANQRSLFEEARFQLQRAELAAAASREELSALLGVWGAGARFRIEPELPAPPQRQLDVARLESTAVERSLELAIIRQRFAGAAARGDVARARAFLPELKAGVVAEREERWSLGPAVELELPLFYQGQAERGVAAAQQRQQRYLYADQAVRLRASARSAATRLRAAADATRYYREVLLPLRERVVEESQLQYNGMLIGLFQLLQAKRDEVEARAAYVEQLRDFWLARTDVEQLLSGRFVSVGAAAIPVASPSGGSSGVDDH